jgi:hypothetical protein
MGQLRILIHDNSKLPTIFQCSYTHYSDVLWVIKYKKLFCENLSFKVLTCESVPNVVRTLFKVWDNLSAPERRNLCGWIGGRDTEEKLIFVHLLCAVSIRCLVDFNEYRHSLSNRSWRHRRVALVALGSTCVLISKSVVWNVNDSLRLSDRMMTDTP